MANHVTSLAARFNLVFHLDVSLKQFKDVANKLLARPGATPAAPAPAPAARADVGVKTDLKQVLLIADPTAIEVAVHEFILGCVHVAVLLLLEFKLCGVGDRLFIATPTDVHARPAGWCSRNTCALWLRSPRLTRTMRPP